MIGCKIAARKPRYWDNVIVSFPIDIIINALILSLSRIYLLRPGIKSITHMPQSINGFYAL